MSVLRNYRNNLVSISLKLQLETWNGDVSQQVWNGSALVSSDRLPPTMYHQSFHNQNNHGRFQYVDCGRKYPASCHFPREHVRNERLKVIARLRLLQIWVAIEKMTGTNSWKESISNTCFAGLVIRLHRQCTWQAIKRMDVCGAENQERRRRWVSFYKANWVK